MRASAVCSNETVPGDSAMTLTARPLALVLLAIPVMISAQETLERGA